MPIQDYIIALPPGSVIHHYRLKRVLGQGGFGVVYLAAHEHLGSEVAIKELFPPDLVGRQGLSAVCHNTLRAAVYEECLRRFKEEGITLKKLEHPSVVRCHDLFLANGTAYLVMDYEEGESLQRLLHRNEAQGKYYSERLLLNLLIRIAEGIDYLHCKGVYHRDIKPDNVYIRKQDDSPVLLDFGAAKHAIAKETQSKAPYTDFYAPIEQVSAEGELKATVDIHAFGGLMYRIVTRGEGPKAETRSMQVAFGKHDPLVPAKLAAKGPYSETFLALIDHCLAFNADNRPQSMAEVLGELTGLSKGRSVEAAPVQATSKDDNVVPSSSTDADSKANDSVVGNLPRRWGAAILLMVLAGVGGWQYQRYLVGLEETKAVSRVLGGSVTAFINYENIDGENLNKFVGEHILDFKKFAHINNEIAECGRNCSWKLAKSIRDNYQDKVLDKAGRLGKNLTSSFMYQEGFGYEEDAFFDFYEGYENKLNMLDEDGIALHPKITIPLHDLGSYKLFLRVTDFCAEVLPICRFGTLMLTQKSESSHYYTEIMSFDDSSVTAGSDCSTQNIFRREYLLTVVNCKPSRYHQGYKVSTRKIDYDTADYKDETVVYHDSEVGPGRVSILLRIFDFTHNNVLKEEINFQYILANIVSENAECIGKSKWASSDPFGWDCELVLEKFKRYEVLGFSFIAVDSGKLLIDFK